MSAHNPNARLEAFSDGVFAIAATLLIIEIKVPTLDTLNEHNTLWQALAHHWASWMAYILSFGTMFIGWINTHALFKYLNKTSNQFIYANGLLLMCIASFPFPTALMAEYIGTEYEQTGIIVYGIFSLFCNVAWVVLFHSAIKPKNLAKNEASFAKLIQGRKLCMQGFVLFLFILVMAFWFPRIALCLMILSWFVWLILGIVFGNKAEVED